MKILRFKKVILIVPPIPMICRYGYESGPPTAQMFGNAGREHMQRYGTTTEHFGKIAQKNHSHSKNNPKSQFKDEYSIEQINGAPCIHDPLTKLHCCPTSDGAAAVIIGQLVMALEALGENMDQRTKLVNFMIVIH